MAIDFQRFVAACNPRKPLDLAKPEDFQYYTDFSSVRGSNIIRKLGWRIMESNAPTCQLFTGYVGCGKSTELFRLKKELEDKDFFVIYFESTDELDTADVDVTDVLLSIARQVSENLENKQIYLQPQGFRKLLQETVNFLQTPIDLTNAEVAVPGGPKGSVANQDGKTKFSLSLGIGSITAETRKDANLRDRMRQYIAPRTTTLIKLINEELLVPANAILKQRGKQELVVLVDNLDRIGRQPTAVKRPLNERLFIEQGVDLSRLSCHVVYTIPLELLYTNDRALLEDRLNGGTETKILPMVPIQSRNGEIYEDGLKRLRQMVLCRAFPALTPEQRLECIGEIFDNSETLDRLCLISGGHVRKLLALLISCLEEADLPLSHNCLERVIREYRGALLSTIDPDEWKLIVQVVKHQRNLIQGDEQFRVLIPSTFFFEYPGNGEDGRWFGLNPVLAETREFKEWMERIS